MACWSPASATAAVSSRAAALLRTFALGSGEEQTPHLGDVAGKNESTRDMFVNHDAAGYVRPRRLELRSSTEDGGGGRILTGAFFEIPIYDVKSPCVVVYCPSANAGVAVEAEAVQLAQFLLPVRVSVLCIELKGNGWAGCGFTDVTDAVECLRGLGYERVALWGRGVSGSLLALRCAASDPSLAALVCDHGDGVYEDTVDLPVIPQWLSSPLYGLKRLAVSSVASVAGQVATENAIGPWLMESSAREAASSCFVPALFVDGSTDGISPQGSAKELVDAYAGERQLILLPKTVSSSGQKEPSTRPEAVIAKVALFMARAFRREEEGLSEISLAIDGLIAAANSAAVPAQPAAIEAPGTSTRWESVALNTLEPESPNASQREIERLVGSSSVADKHKGLVLAALAACPSYQGALLSEIRLPQISGSDPCLVHVAGTVTLPTAASEAALIWATGTPSSGPHEPNDLCGGSVNLALVSPNLLGVTTVSVARVYRESSDGMQGIITESALSEITLLPGATPHELTLTVGRDGVLGLSVGGGNAMSLRSACPDRVVSLWAASFQDGEAKSVSQLELCSVHRRAETTPARAVASGVSRRLDKVAPVPQPDRRSSGESVVFDSPPTLGNGHSARQSNCTLLSNGSFLSRAADSLCFSDASGDCTPVELLRAVQHQQTSAGTLLPNADFVGVDAGSPLETPSFGKASSPETGTAFYFGKELLKNSSLRHTTQNESQPDIEPTREDASLMDDCRAFYSARMTLDGSSLEAFDGDFRAYGHTWPGGREPMMETGLPARFVTWSHPDELC